MSCVFVLSAYLQYLTVMTTCKYLCLLFEFLSDLGLGSWEAAYTGLPLNLPSQISPTSDWRFAARRDGVRGVRWLGGVWHCENELVGT